MSVINNMLRDLNKRQAPERSPDYINASADDAQQSMIEPHRPNSVTLLSLAFIIVLLLLGVAGYLLLSGQDSQTQAGTQTTALVTSEVKPIENITEQPVERRKENPKMLVNSAPYLAGEIVVKTKVKSKTTEKAGIEQPPIEATASTVVVSSPKQVTVPMREKSHEPERVKEKLEYVRPPTQPKRVKVQTALTAFEQDAKTAEQAVNLFSKGEVSLAYRKLFDFISINEIDQKSRIILAGHLLQDKRIAEAGDVILGVSVKGDPQYRQIKARWQEAKGDVNLAIKTLASSLPDIREHSTYYVLLASYYQRFGQPEMAVNIYTLLLEYDDHVANWWAGLAISSDRTEKWEQARFAYHQALQLPELNTKIIPYAQKRLAELNIIKNKSK